MKSLRIPLLAAATALLSLTPLAAQVDSYKDIKTPPLPQVKVEQPKRVELGNGMVLFLMEDHELPLIRGFARIRGGSREVPAAKAGLVSIYGQAWRTGGTESKTGDQLDDFLEARAARVESGGGDDSTNLNLNLLKGDFDAVFPIFVDLLRHPAFRQDKIDLAKTTMNTVISRRNDEPGQIINREAMKLALGVNSPYTEQPEYSTVASITRDDLLAFHNKYVHPNNIIFGIVGDFDTASMEKKLRAAFESWPKGPQAPRVAPPAGTAAKPGVYFIAKDDVTQSNIAIVAPGQVSRRDPDYYPVAVMNEVLSGGFSGRLMNHIRTQMGLAYGVGGSLAATWEGPGAFRTSMGTKSSTTVQAINALRGEVNDLVTKPITTDEVAAAKEILLNAYVFTMDSRSKVLNQRIGLEFYGYPADYYQHYVENIQKVTPADVERVAKKYVNPANTSILVVGKAKDFDQPLTTVGSVTPIDVTIPEAGAKPAGAKPAASNAEGIALAKKVQDFFGGAAKLNSIQAVRTVGTINTKTPMGAMDIEVDSLTKYPDSRRNVMKTPMGEMTMVTTADGGFMIGPNGAQDLPGSQTSMMKNESKSDEMTVLRNIDNPKYTFTVTGNQKVGNVDAKVLEINADGATVKWVVDPATGKLLRRISSGPRGETMREYTDWKNVNGVNLPSAFSLTTNGEPSGAGKITAIEINPTIDPNAFVKPAK